MLLLENDSDFYLINKVDSQERDVLEIAEEKADEFVINVIQQCMIRFLSGVLLDD
jgi:hypothetical protein